MSISGNYNNIRQFLAYPCEQLVDRKEGLLFEKIYCPYVINTLFMYEMIHINIIVEYLFNVSLVVTKMA